MVIERTNYSLRGFAFEGLYARRLVAGGMFVR